MPQQQCVSPTHPSCHQRVPYGLLSLAACDEGNQALAAKRRSPRSHKLGGGELEFSASVYHCTCLQGHGKEHSNLQRQPRATCPPCCHCMQLHFRAYSTKLLRHRSRPASAMTKSHEASTVNERTPHHTSTVAAITPQLCLKLQ